jgi:hypothetical protein
MFSIMFFCRGGCCSHGSFSSLGLSIKRLFLPLSLFFYPLL